MTGNRTWHRVADGALAFGCFLLSLFLYLRTLAPSVAALFDDSLEFPLAVYRLAIVHPTGYPFYTLLGKLFTLLPWRNVAWRANLLSAVAGALTVALVYGIVRKLARRRWAALLGALALAVSPIFWSQAVVAEVYTLNAAFVAGLLYLALHWARQPFLPVQPFSLLLGTLPRPSMLFPPGEGLQSRLPPAVRRAAHRLHTAYRRTFPAIPARRRLRIHSWLYALAALYGFSLTHHRTVLLLAPALLLFVLLVEPRALSRAALLGPEHPERPRWRQIAGRPIVLLTLCLLAPLLLYLYLPIRGHVGSLDGTYANTWSGFWRWVTASAYTVFLGDNPLARDLDAAFYGKLFWQQFGPLGLALGLVGVLGLASRGVGPLPPAAPPGSRSALGPGARRRLGRRALALTGLAFLVYVTFGIVYLVPDVEVFFIPAFLVAAIWIGAGLDYAADLLRIRGPSLALRRTLAIGSLLLVLVAIAQPLAIAARNYPDLDASRRWLVHDYGRYVLAQELEPGSTLIGLLGEMTLLRYFQETEGLRPDLDTVVADDETERRRAVDQALAAGDTVYLTRPLPGVTDNRALSAITGPIRVDGHLESLLRAGDPDGTAPALPRPTNLEILPGLELLGYGLHEHHGHWQGWARLRLWWRAPQGLADPVQVSARLIDAAGQTVAAYDAPPLAGAYPTTAWRPGEVVADAYEIPLPAGLAPGDYRPQVIVYDPVTGTELGRADLEPVYVQGNPVRPPQRALEAGVAQTTYARFGDVDLLGFTPPDPGTAYRPGEALPLTLLWQAVEQPAGDLRAAFWLQAIEGYALGAEPLGGRYPADQWTAGQVVRHGPDLRVPDSVPPGTYRLVMRVTRDGQPLPWGRWLIPLGSDLDLGPVQIGRQGEP